MKKFLAILLACVMTLALAVPAMADTTKVTATSPANCQLTLAEGDGECIEYTVTGLGAGYTVEAVSQDTAVVTIRTVQNSCCIIDAGTAGTTSVRIYVCDENGEEVQNSGCVVLVTVNPPATDTTVNSFNAVFDAKVGDKVYATQPTITSDPENGVLYDGTDDGWYKWPTDSATMEDMVQVGLDEEFEAGYTYGCAVRFVPNDGFVFKSGTTEMYLNSEAVDPSNEFHDYFTADLFLTFDAADAQNQSTDGITITGTTTTTTAAVKTGDSSNAMFYVLALIALVAGAGVTLFATKKSR